MRFDSKQTTVNSLTQGNSVDDVIERMGKKPVRSTSRTFVGEVVDNKGPDLLGKCRIRVNSVYPPEIPDDMLPWAVPVRTFAGSKMGNFVVPTVGTKVVVEFENDDIYSPRYSFKTADANASSIAGIGDDYPDTMVLFETDNGEYLKINRKTRMTIYRHSTGIMLGIDGNGNVRLSTAPGDEGTVEMDIEGNLDIRSKANISLSAESHVSISGTTVCINPKNQLHVSAPANFSKDIHCGGRIDGIHTHVGNLGVLTSPPVTPVVIPPAPN